MSKSSVHNLYNFYSVAQRRVSVLKVLGGTQTPGKYISARTSLRRLMVSGGAPNVFY